MWQQFLSRTRTNPRRDRNSRTRRTSLERLEERTLLSYTDFELSSLLPANGGDGSKGFVVNGILDGGRLGAPSQGYQPLGDVNEDGIDDFSIAAAGASTDPPEKSTVYLVLGEPGGFPSEFDLQTLNGANGYRMKGTQVGAPIGGFLSGAGDLNHDGVLDLAIWAKNADPSSDRVDAGQIFVIFGGQANLAALDAADGAPDAQINLEQLNGQYGFTINGAVASSHTGMINAAGDLNGDLVDDLVIATNWAYGPNGKAYVVFGRDSTLGSTFPSVFELSSLNGSNGFSIPGPFGDNSAAVSGIAGGGDVNGDGIGDLLLTSWTANVGSLVNNGQGYVIFGRVTFPASFDLTLLNGSNGFKVNGSASNDWLGGWGADMAGDVNGDGVDDLVIPVRGLDSVGGAVGISGSNAGGAVVVFGRTTAFPATLWTSDLNGSNGLVMRGVTPGDGLGSATGAGDVNGDGFDDILLASVAADPHGITDAGQSYLVYGRPKFGANLELSSLLAADGGDGSAGFVINGFVPSSPTIIAAVGDVNDDGFADVRVTVYLADSNGLTDNGQVLIIYGMTSPPATKFYVVNDSSTDRTYEYTATGGSKEDYALNSGNTAPRGAASTAAGDKVWVVDNNKKVYVYNPGGTLLGSWTAGSLHANATVEGITTNGTDVWIVDSYQDKVFRYNDAASRLSGSQNAASSFNLSSTASNNNTSPKDLVTDGTSLWVVNDSSTDKVFKYNLSGTLLGSWTISGAGASPTGITLDPSNVSNLWMVDSGTRRVYQFDNAASRTSGSQSPSTSFALAAGNANPQGIADPPVPTTGASRVATLNKTSHPSGHLAAHLGRTIPGLPASRSTGSILSRIPGLPALAGRQETPILISLVPSTDLDQDITLLGADLLRTGAKRSRSMLTRTKV